ncbi:MAG: 50S ribosomal protein L11 methyltransferase [Anaerolineales bacterium]
MNWLEVSLIVDGEMAEAVADVLGEYVPGGVVIASTKIEVTPEGEGHPVGPLRVCGYLPVDENLETTRQKIEEGLWYLRRIHQLLPPPKFQSLQETNWVDTWKKHYRPIPVGKRLLILPAWFDAPGPGAGPERRQRMPIKIEPGMAFGTGTHPTTQLCLELLENQIETGILVIDVGCGSGILSIAALKLGAASALGVDVDSDAVTSARENAELNGVAGRLELGIGSAIEVKAGNYSIQQAPVVLANILAPILIRLLDQGLADLLTPGGVLLLSGILAEQEEGMLAALAKHSLQVVARRQIGDWVGLETIPG